MNGDVFDNQANRDALLDLFPAVIETRKEEVLKTIDFILQPNPQNATANNISEKHVNSLDNVSSVADFSESNFENLLHFSSQKADTFQALSELSPDPVHHIPTKTNPKESFNDSFSILKKADPPQTFNDPVHHINPKESFNNGFSIHKEEYSPRSFNDPVHHIPTKTNPKESFNDSFSILKKADPPQTFNDPVHHINPKESFNNGFSIHKEEYSPRSFNDPVLPILTKTNKESFNDSFSILKQADPPQTFNDPVHHIPTKTNPKESFNNGFSKHKEADSSRSFNETTSGIYHNNKWHIHMQEGLKIVLSRVDQGTKSSTSDGIRAKLRTPPCTVHTETLSTVTQIGPPNLIDSPNQAYQNHQINRKRKNKVKVSEVGLPATFLKLQEDSTKIRIKNVTKDKTCTPKLFNKNEKDTGRNETSCTEKLGYNHDSILSQSEKSLKRNSISIQTSKKENELSKNDYKEYKTEKEESSVESKESKIGSKKSKTGSKESKIGNKDVKIESLEIKKPKDKLESSSSSKTINDTFLNSKKSIPKHETDSKKKHVILKIKPFKTNKVTKQATSNHSNSIKIGLNSEIISNGSKESPTKVSEKILNSEIMEGQTGKSDPFSNCSDPVCKITEKLESISVKNKKDENEFAVSNHSKSHKSILLISTSNNSDQEQTLRKTSEEHVLVKQSRTQSGSQMNGDIIEGNMVKHRKLDNSSKVPLNQIDRKRKNKKKVSEVGLPATLLKLQEDSTKISTKSETKDNTCTPKLFNKNDKDTVRNEISGTEKLGYNHDSSLPQSKKSLKRNSISSQTGGNICTSQDQLLLVSETQKTNNENRGTKKEKTESRKENQDTKKENNESKNKNKESKKKNKISEKEKESIVEIKGSKKENTESTMESKESKLGNKESKKENEASKNDNKKYKVENKESTVESKEAKIEIKEIKKENKASNKEIKKSKVENNKPGKEIKTFQKEKKQHIFENKQAKPVIKETVKENKASKTENKESTIESKESKIGSKESITGSKELKIGSKESITGSRESKIGSKESKTGSKESKTGSKESITGSKESITGSKESITGSRELKIGSKESITGSRESKIGSKESKTGSKGSKIGSKESKTGSKESKIENKESVRVNNKASEKDHLQLKDLLLLKSTSNDSDREQTLRRNLEEHVLVKQSRTQSSSQMNGDIIEGNMVKHRKLDNSSKVPLNQIDRKRKNKEKVSEVGLPATLLKLQEDSTKISTKSETKDNTCTPKLFNKNDKDTVRNEISSTEKLGYNHDSSLPQSKKSLKRNSISSQTGGNICTSQEQLLLVSETQKTNNENRGTKREKTESRKENQDTKKENNESKNKNKEPKKKNKISEKEKESIDEIKGTKKEKTESTMESKESKLGNKESKKENEASKNDNKKYKVENKESTVESKEAKIEIKEIKKENKASNKEIKKSKVENNKPEKEIKTFQKEKKQHIFENKQAKSVIKETVKENKDSKTENKESTIESKESKIGSKESITGSKELKIGSKESITGSRESKIGSKESKTGSKESKTGSKESITGSKELKIGSKESITGSRESKIGSKESKTGSKESKTGSKESITGSKESITGSKELKIGSKESITGSRESKIGSKESKTGSKGSKIGSKESKTGSKESKIENKESFRVNNKASEKDHLQLKDLLLLKSTSNDSDREQTLRRNLEEHVLVKQSRTQSSSQMNGDIIEGNMVKHRKLDNSSKVPLNQIDRKRKNKEKVSEVGLPATLLKLQEDSTKISTKSETKDNTCTPKLFNKNDKDTVRNEISSTEKLGYNHDSSLPQSKKSLKRNSISSQMGGNICTSQEQLLLVSETQKTNNENRGTKKEKTESRKENQDTKKENNESKNKNKEPKKKNKISEKEKESIVEIKGTKKEKTESTMESKESKLGNKESKKENEASKNDNKKYKVENKESTVESKEAKIEIKEIKKENKASSKEIKKSKVENNKPEKEIKTFQKEKKQHIFENKQAKSVIKETVKENKASKTENKESTIESKESKIGSKESITGSKELKIGSKESITGSRESKIGSKESKTGSKESKTGSKESITGSKESITGSKESITGSKELKIGSKESITGSRESKIGSKESKTGSKGSKIGSKESKTGSKESKIENKESVRVNNKASEKDHLQLKDLLLLKSTSNDSDREQTLRRNSEEHVPVQSRKRSSSHMNGDIIEGNMVKHRKLDNSSEKNSHKKKKHSKNKKDTHPERKIEHETISVTTFITPNLPNHIKQKNSDDTRTLNYQITSPDFEKYGKDKNGIKKEPRQDKEGKKSFPVKQLKDAKSPSKPNNILNESKYSVSNPEKSSAKLRSKKNKSTHRTDTSYAADYEKSILYKSQKLESDSPKNTDLRTHVSKSRKSFKASKSFTKKSNLETNKAQTGISENCNSSKKGLNVEIIPSGSLTGASEEVLHSEISEKLTRKSEVVEDEKSNDFAVSIHCKSYFHHYDNSKTDPNNEIISSDSLTGASGKVLHSEISELTRKSEVEEDEKSNDFSVSIHCKSISDHCDKSGTDPNNEIISSDSLTGVSGKTLHSEISKELTRESEVVEDEKSNDFSMSIHCKSYSDHCNNSKKYPNNEIISSDSLTGASGKVMNSEINEELSEKSEVEEDEKRKDFAVSIYCKSPCDNSKKYPNNEIIFSDSLTGASGKVMNSEINEELSEKSEVEDNEKNEFAVSIHCKSPSPILRNSASNDVDRDQTLRRTSEDHVPAKQSRKRNSSLLSGGSIEGNEAKLQKLDTSSKDNDSQAVKELMEEIICTVCSMSMEQAKVVNIISVQSNEETSELFSDPQDAKVFKALKALKFSMSNSTSNASKRKSESDENISGRSGSKKRKLLIKKVMTRLYYPTIESFERLKNEC